MMRYGIADYLTSQQRRAIADAKYPNVGRTYRQRLTLAGCCPMGVLALDYDHSPSAPDGDTVARALYRDTDLDLERDDPEEWLDRVAALAQEFIDDWDAGKIHPSMLPVALGLVADAP